ncbi:MAG: GNAT family N-acetyltransferase [Clostridia bacterium]
MTIQELDLRLLNEHKIDIMRLIRQVMNRSFPISKIPHDYEQKTLQELHAGLSNDKIAVFLAISNNKLVGLIWVCIIKKLLEERLHVVQLVIDDDFQNLGVGTKLMAKAEDYALSKNVGVIELFVTEDNTSAVNFYEKHDFNVERKLLRKEILKK